MRPENTALLPGDGSDLRLKVSLEHVEYLGDCTLCYCRGYGQNIVVQLGPDENQELVQGQNLEFYVDLGMALKSAGNRRDEGGLAV